MKKNKKGFAMIFAIMLAVALQASVAGGLLETMMHQRGAQRLADQTRLAWVGEAVVDRTLQLFEDYLLSKNTFPSAEGGNPETGADAVVNGDDGPASIYHNSNKKKFNLNIKDDWFEDFKADYADILSQIELTGLTIKQSGPQDEPDKWRRYEIAVTLKHLQSLAETTISQTAKISNGQLFNFAVFFNEELEIGAGPDFTLQGPVFSNRHTYLMNNAGNTLTLELPADYEAPDIAEPYALRSAGNIYFYFNRAVAKNYLLPNPAYEVPLVYQTAPDGVELTPYYGKLKDIAGSEHPRPPRYYFFSNNAKLGSSGGVPGSKGTNTLQAEKSPDAFAYLTPSWPDYDTEFVSFGEYQRYTLKDPDQNVYGKKTDWDTGSVPTSDKFVNTSMALDPFSFPRLSTGWSPENPDSNPPPPPNPIWPSVISSVFGGAATIADQASNFNVETKNVPIGDPDHPAKAHLLIDPLTKYDSEGNLQPKSPGVPLPDIGGMPYPPDTPEVADVKFQSRADFNLYCANASGTGCGGSSDYSEDLYNWSDALPASERPVTFGEIYDYRIGQERFFLQINVEKLMDQLTEEEHESGVSIYVHSYPLDEGTGGSEWNFVLARNGRALPKGGLTIITNGRLFMRTKKNDGRRRAEYNAFSYAQTNAAGEVCTYPDDFDDKNCYCTDAEWDSEDCHVPPAAIFSDSFVLLSSNYNNSNDGSTPLTDRRVMFDSMVNTAVATGYMRSQLKELYPQCKTDVSDCEFRPGFRPNPPFAPPGANQLGVSNLLRCNDGSWPYPGPPSADCQYYQDENGFFHANTNYGPLEAWLSDNGRTLESLEGYPSDGTIPVFADPMESSAKGPTYSYTPIRAFTGVYFIQLRRDVLFDIAGIEAGTVCDPSNGGQYCPGNDTVCPDGTVCSGNRSCSPSGGEGTYVCGNCNVPLQCQAPLAEPIISYASWIYLPLYEAKYSGGLENLINFQESWRYEDGAGNDIARTLRFSGTLSAPWFSKELTAGGAPKYWKPEYYQAPIRLYDYNEDLKSDPPPDTPGVFSIDRERWNAQ